MMVAAELSQVASAAGLAALYQQLVTSAAIDGRQLVATACREPSLARVLAGGPLSVLALGKAAPSMVLGIRDVVGPGVGALPDVLVIAPPRPLAATALPSSVRVVQSDHPSPSERSLEAGRQARDFVDALAAPTRLLVLLSGGGSALAVLPAPGLELADKRAATSAVSAAGASIKELNAVRKHLSAIKGGQLALRARVPVQVLALSDVLGDDPATIASGPFAGDPTTFAEALAIVNRLAPDVPAVVRRRLEDGARGALEETPKPGEPRLAHVATSILAGPTQVALEAERLVQARGLLAGELSRDVSSEVPALAQLYVQRARREAGAGQPRVLVGNGEPVVVLDGAAAAAAGNSASGGRCSHLALLVARGIAGLPGVAFLAAGTDDRDGSSDAAGAVVDGQTWSRALAAGLDPEAALTSYDSARPLAALGCLVRSPGTSNLLDVHLLGVTGAT